MIMRSFVAFDVRAAILNDDSVDNNRRRCFCNLLSQLGILLPEVCILLRDVLLPINLPLEMVILLHKMGILLHELGILLGVGRSVQQHRLHLHLAQKFGCSCFEPDATADDHVPQALKIPEERSLQCGTVQRQDGP